MITQGRIFTLIKSNDVRRYNKLEKVCNKNRSDCIYLFHLEHEITNKGRFIGFFKSFFRNECISFEQNVIHELSLPVDNLSDYKVGDIIEVEINFKNLSQQNFSNVKRNES